MPTMEQDLNNIDIDLFFKTSEMSLVTYLKMEGFTAQTMIWDDMAEECYWIYDRSESLEDHIDRYMKDEATVVPREYSRMFVKVRQEFFRFKNQSGR